MARCRTSTTTSARGGDEPDWATEYPREWAKAGMRPAAGTGRGRSREASQRTHRRDPRAKRRQLHPDRWSAVPAYSLVGRARNQGKKNYVASADEKHFLYKEYIRILDRLQPAAFVMENVKGMLSSSVDGENRIFDQVLRDLRGERPGPPNTGSSRLTRDPAASWICRPSSHALPISSCAPKTSAFRRPVIGSSL